MKKFEGLEVVGSTIAITKAGDGLSAALALAPVELHHGDIVYYVLRGEVEQVLYNPLGDDMNLLVRHHRIKTMGITGIDPTVAHPLIAAAENAVAEAQAEAQKIADEKSKGIELELED